MELERSHTQGKLSILLAAQIICVILTMASALTVFVSVLKLVSDDRHPGPSIVVALFTACSMLVNWGLAIVFAHTRTSIAAEANIKAINRHQILILCPNGHAISCRYAETGTRVRCAACGAWTEVPSLSRLGMDRTGD